MKKIALLLCLALMLGALTGCGSKTAEESAAPVADKAETVETAETTQEKAKSDVELTVFNWYDYIDPAVIDMFEEETGVTVKYVNFTTNEEMYTKIEAGAGTYDVLFPSEYMIERMIKNDMLAELDLSKMPNTENLIASMRDPSYDPGNKYSIAYMWGTLGILYNTEMVPEGVTSWASLFDSKYAGNVIMMNSMRDTLGLALKYQGHSMNTRDEAELSAARDILIKQKQDKIESGYLLDETKDKMVGNEAAMAVIYSGDAQYAIEKNEKLDYVVPEEGSNIWVDGMVIPKSSQNQETAMQFIDFMCRPDVAQMNFDYIYYCSPIQQVVDNLSEEDAAMATINPSEEVQARCEFFNDVSDCMELYENAWMEVRLAR